MLYGYKEMLDDRIATIVSAADSIIEYDTWADGIKNVDITDPDFPCNEVYASELLDHMMREEFSGYKRPVLAFYHDSEEQRDLFFDRFAIKEVQSMAARDLQQDMLHEEKVQAENEAKDRERAFAESMGEEYREKTIAELAGVDEHDPWDKRTEAQKAADAQKNEAYEALRKAGKISDDSFGSAEEIRDIKNRERADKGLPPIPGEIKIDEIRATIKPDGSIDMADITAHKTDGPVDSDLKKAREKTSKETIEKATGGFDLFSADDFASVLGGEASDAIEEAKASEASRLADNLKEEKAKSKAEAEEADKKALEDNTFLAVSLDFSDEVEVSTLPEVVREKLAEIAERTIFKVPYDEMPESSRVDNKVIIPSGFGNPSAPSVAEIIGLDHVGTIALGRQLTSIYEVTEGESYIIFRKFEDVAGDRYMVLKIRK